MTQGTQLSLTNANVEFEPTAEWDQTNGVIEVFLNSDLLAGTVYSFDFTVRCSASENDVSVNRLFVALTPVPLECYSKTAFHQNTCIDQG